MVLARQRCDRRRCLNSGHRRDSCRQECDKVDEYAPELHAGIAAADRPVPARAGGAVARHLCRHDLPHRHRLHRRHGLPDRHRLSLRRLRQTRQHHPVPSGRHSRRQHLRRVQHVSRRIPAAEFLHLQAPWRPHHPGVERHHDLPVDGRLPGANQRRIFARLDRAVLWGDPCRSRRLALLHRAGHHGGARRRADFGAAHFPDRHRRQRQRLRQPL